MLPHHVIVDLIGHFWWRMDWEAIEVLDPPGVVLTKSQGVGVAVEGRHDRARFQRVLQAQNMAKLVSCNLQ